MDSFIERYKAIWLVDFEFIANGGDRPQVVCLVAKELVSNRVYRFWQNEIRAMKEPPYDIGDDSLFIAYFASAEMASHLALGWPLPMNVLDLYTEFRNLSNGLALPNGAGLIGALTWFGLDSMAAAEKSFMRDLILRGGPWSSDEKASILAYCQSDVDVLEPLLIAMSPSIDLDRALLRGAYMKAVASIEHCGVPIDIAALKRLREDWNAIQSALIDRIAGRYEIYDQATFKQDKFAEFLIEHDIPWPRLTSGKLDLSDATFKDMARAYPLIAPLRELREALSKMRLLELSVGRDGRNRTLLSPFRSRTSRNQPSNSRFIFGPSVWLRSLIKPPEGCGLAYVDWSQQEFGIAAALSGDTKMKEAYQSGDPYLAFAKQAGAAPSDATKQSHKAEREQFKACVLAVQYGMGAESLAERINQPVVRAKELLRLHRETYRTFWAWSDAAVDYAMLHGKLWTVFGWTIHVGENVNPRFLRNFLMQANGAEMLRLACIQLAYKGISVCAPIHDAVLIEAPLLDLNEIIKQTQQIMSDVSATVLGGFRLNSDVDVVRYPDRYSDERGREMWDNVMDLLNERCVMDAECEN